MKIILTTLCIVFSVSLFAQFSGYYAPSNWTSANDPACANGYTDASGAPASVTVVGAEGACAGVQSYSITVQLCGTISFDWAFTTTDCQGPYWDPFGYSVNGVGTQLTDDNGVNNQSGNVSVDVEAGDVFAFYMYSVDAFCGVAWTAVTNFSGAPDAVCYGDLGEVKMEICHKGKSLCVALSSVAAHLAHGDVIGTCDENASCEEEEGQALYAEMHSVGATEAKKEEQIQVRNAAERLSHSLSSKPVSVESYPNPAKDAVSFKSMRMEGGATISVFDTKGVQVYTQETMLTRGQSYEMNVNKLINGIYNVKFENAAGQSVQSTITVVK